MPTSTPGAHAIVLADPGTRPPERWCDAKIVYTPLDLIVALDDEVAGVVVLMGSRAREPALCSFLRESYPHLDVVDGVASPHVARPRAFPAGSQPAIKFDTSGDATGGEHTDPVEPRYS